MRLYWLLITGLLLLAPGLALARKAPQGVPDLRCYKSGFALGEDVEFYINIKGITREQIYELYQENESGWLVIKAPNGKKTISKVELRYSGIHSEPILGYNSIRKEDVVAGRYTLLFEYAGQRTLPITVTVADLPILKKISATLRLDGDTGFPQSFATKHATLTVKNNTDQTIRFPRLSDLAGLSVFVRVTQGAWKGRTFSTYSPPPRPIDTLFNFYEFTWAAARALPTVTLHPGEKFEQQIPLESVRQSYMSTSEKELPVPAGQYEVSLDKEFNVLVGEQQDAQSGFFPVRIPLNVTVLFTVAPGVPR